MQIANDKKVHSLVLKSVSRRTWKSEGIARPSINNRPYITHWFAVTGFRKAMENGGWVHKYYVLHTVINVKRQLTNLI